MKSAASSVRNDDFDIRDAARREARRSGVSLGQWLDGVMTERADAMGLRLADLDPGERIAAIVTRLNGAKAEEPASAQPHAGLGSYALETAAPTGALGTPAVGMPLDDEPEEQVMREERSASLQAQEEPPAPPVFDHPDPSRQADASPGRPAGAARRHAAQRVEIETKLNALFAALDRTPRRRDPPSPDSDFAEQVEPARRRRVLLGETAIASSWRLEKAVSEIAERQAFLEGPPTTAVDAAAMPARPVARRAASQAGPATDSARRPAPEPVPSIFTSLQGDLARIAKRLDAVHLDVTRRPQAPSEPTVQEMRALLDQMRPDASIDLLGRQVEALSSKLDAVIDQRVPKAALSQLSQRIEDVHSELAARLAANTAAPVVDMGAVEQLIAAALDRAGRSAPAMPDLGPLESAVHDLADKIEKAERAQDGSSALVELQAQIGTLASRIDRSDDGLTAIVALERSLADMASQLGSMRDASLVAMESTARAVAEETVQTALARPDFAATLAASVSEAALEQMSHDVADMRADREDADSRLHAILAALNTSLERVVDRLGALEEDAVEHRRAPQPSVAPSASASPIVPDWSESLEQAVALGVAERPAPTPSRRRDEPLDLPVHVQTDGWEARGLGSLGRPQAFDDGPQPATNAPDPTSFIAAARRAAQAAMQSEVHKGRPDPVEFEDPDRVATAPTELRARFKIGMLTQRRPLLLAAAGLVLLIGIAQVVRISLSGADSTGSIPASDMTATTRAPAVETPSSPGSKADAVDDAGFSMEAETATPSVAPPASANATERTAAVAPPPVAPSSAAGIIAQSDPMATHAPLPTMAMGPGASIAALQAAETSTRAAAAGGLAPALRTQAESGVPAAQFEAGLRYADGRGVGRDLPTAARWFEKAAQQGLAPAAYRLGSLYEKGLGVARDPAKAIEWYRKAADAGNIRAMHNLAVLLAEGATGKSDYPAAATWFTKAAQAGVRDSQFNLAILYARGLGVPQNLAQSYTWFAIAAAQGDQDSVKKRDEVEGHLDAATLDQAKATAASFTPEPSVSAANEVPQPAGGWDAAPRGADTAAPGTKVPANAHVSRM